MYFVKRITLDDKQGYLSSKIVADTNKTIKSALLLLESSVRAFVRDERGREAAEQVKIIDIHNIGQVSEPILDGILLYRLESDPLKINVYQKKTIVVKSTTWTWGTTDTPVPQFRRTDIFELEEYGKKIAIPVDASSTTNAVPTATIVESEPEEKEEKAPLGPAKLLVPKKMTVSPMCDLINELKRSPKFKSRLNSTNVVTITEQPNPEKKTSVEISKLKTDVEPIAYD